jgi:hypothetical protein
MTETVTFKFYHLNVTIAKEWMFLGVAKLAKASVVCSRDPSSNLDTDKIFSYSLCI